MASLLVYEGKSVIIRLQTCVFFDNITVFPLNCIRNTGCPFVITVLTF